MFCKPFILLLQRDGTIIKDDSGWRLSVFGDFWIARFGPAWREQYPCGATWAVGRGPRRVWWYTPTSARMRRL